MLEWRLDPASPYRIPEATDMTGGVQAWLAAGLPVTTDPADLPL